MGMLKWCRHFLPPRRSHKNLFRAIFIEQTLSRYEGIALIIKNGQQLQELYRQEKALVKLKEIR